MVIQCTNHIGTVGVRKQPVEVLLNASAVDLCNAGGFIELQHIYAYLL